MENLTVKDFIAQYGNTLDLVESFREYDDQDEAKEAFETKFKEQLVVLEDNEFFNVELTDEPELVKFIEDNSDEICSLLWAEVLAERAGEEADEQPTEEAFEDFLRNRE